MATSLDPRFSAQVGKLLQLTSRAWGVPLLSPRALARRAPPVYVPLRRQRRLLAATAFLAHSW